MFFPTFEAPPTRVSNVHWNKVPMMYERDISTFENRFNSFNRSALDGNFARNELLKFNLDQSILFEIWRLSDHDQDGHLTESEYVLAMILCKHASTGNAIPSYIPNEYWQTWNERKNPKTGFQLKFENRNSLGLSSPPSSSIRRTPSMTGKKNKAELMKLTNEVESLKARLHAANNNIQNFEAKKTQLTTQYKFKVDNRENCRNDIIRLKQSFAIGEADITDLNQRLEKLREDLQKTQEKENQLLKNYNWVSNQNSDLEKEIRETRSQLFAKNLEEDEVTVEILKVTTKLRAAEAHRDRLTSEKAQVDGQLKAILAEQARLRELVSQLNSERSRLLIEQCHKVQVHSQNSVEVFDDPLSIEIETNAAQPIYDFVETNPFLVEPKKELPDLPDDSSIFMVNLDDFTAVTPEDSEVFLPLENSPKTPSHEPEKSEAIDFTGEVQKATQAFNQSLNLYESSASTKSSPRSVRNADLPISINPAIMTTSLSHAEELFGGLQGNFTLDGQMDFDPFRQI